MYMGIKNLLFIFVLLIFVDSHCFADHSNVLTLEVAAPRPMAEAVIALGEQLKCPVTYEDIPFEYSDDLRYLFPGSKTCVPSGGRLRLYYEKTSDRLEIIKQLLSQHNLAGNAGVFDVTQTNGIYNVIPLFVFSRRKTSDFRKTNYNSLHAQYHLKFYLN